MYKTNFRINVTEHCNFNCDYCIEKSQKAKSRYNDFDINKTIDLLDKAINKNKERGVFVSFFGGEPTLRKDKIIDFLKAIKHKDYFDDLRFEITTNAYIFFPEIIEFCNEYNKHLKIMISYDAVGQNFRNKDEQINNTVRNNIRKYADIFKKLKLNTSSLSVNCCVVEDNAATIFDSFLDITNKGVEMMKFSSVFTEHWKTESFVKMYKNYNKLYHFIINTNINNKCIKYKIPIIDGGHRDEWKKFNSLFYQTKKDNDFVKKIDISDIYCSETIERRYKNKKHYKIKPIFIDKNIDVVKDIELKTLRFSCFNYTYFDKLTMILLLGDNIKKYKHEIYCLFNFDKFLCNKYIKSIKRLKNKEIIISDFLKENKYLDYFLVVHGKEKTYSLIEKLNKKFELKDIYRDNIKSNIYKNILNELYCTFEELNIDKEIAYIICGNFYKYIYAKRSGKGEEYGK